MKISCVIPCYHSDKTLAPVVEGIGKVMASRPELDYEIILVNDNPPDETWDLICRLREIVLRRLSTACLFLFQPRIRKPRNKS